MADMTERRSRRQMLFGGLAAAAAVTVGRFLRPETAAAANGQAILIGTENVGTDPTKLITTDPSLDPVLALVGVGQARGLDVESEGLGISAVSQHSRALSATSLSTGNSNPAIETLAVGSAGVYSVSTLSHGVVGHAKDMQQTGVLGIVGAVGIPSGPFEAAVAGLGSGQPTAVGVWGDGNEGAGVYGSGATGVVGEGGWGVYGTGGVGVTGDVGPGATGVYGFVGSMAAPVPTQNVAVEARAGSTSYLALNVVGRAKFSRSGRTLIGAGKSSIVISLSGVSASNLVFANLYTYRSGTWVISATPTTNAITIRLNKALTSSAYVVWFVLN